MYEEEAVSILDLDVQKFRSCNTSEVPNSGKVGKCRRVGESVAFCFYGRLQGPYKVAQFVEPLVERTS